MLMVHWLYLFDYSTSKDRCSTGSHLPGIKQYDFYSCEINCSSVNTKHILMDPELCQYRHCSSCRSIIMLSMYSSIYSKSNHYMSFTFIGLLHLLCDTATDFIKTSSSHLGAAKPHHMFWNCRDLHANLPQPLWFKNLTWEISSASNLWNFSSKTFFSHSVYILLFVVMDNTKNIVYKKLNYILKMHRIPNRLKTASGSHQCPCLSN